MANPTLAELADKVPALVKAGIRGLSDDDRLGLTVADNIVAGGASAPTYGAPAGDLLAAVMRVKERPPNNRFVVMLGDYMELVRSGKGETEPALKLRRKLDDLSPQDPGLDRADLEMRRQKVLKRIATNPMEEA